MLTTNNCCCCASLRTGCLIIGWLQLIFPGLDIISAITIKIDGSQQQLIISSGTFWGDMVISIIQFAAAATLLYGVYKLRSRFVFYYICAASLVLALRVLLLIVFIATSTQSDVWPPIVAAIIVCGFFLYLLIVVYSYHKELVSSSNNL